MELETITTIREIRDEIRDKIKQVDFSMFSDEVYGGESEYNFKGLIGGIEALLTDISSLTKAPKKLVKISTSTERSNIVNYLNSIDRYFENPDSYLNDFESLKILLRSYNLRNTSERQIEFEKEIEDTRRIKIELQQELIEVIKIREKVEENDLLITSSIESNKEKLADIESEFEVIVENKDNLIEQSETLEGINNELDSIKEDADEALEHIVNSKNESKSNEKLIASFAANVQEREKRLSELEQKIVDNREKINQYENERKGILKEAQTLIESAKKALNYKTAEGISASFQEQYISSNNSRILGGWILGAVICLLSTIVLGVWILQASPSNIGLLIGRISLLPLPIIGAIFCANQYTKQKNIIEDYAYKMTLSKAIVGFSEQLRKNGTENNEEYIHYIKTALEEIHRDPLRKRSKRVSNKKTTGETTNFKELVEAAERIVKMSKLK